MKNRLLLTLALLAMTLILAGCTGKPDDTIAKFAAAVNDNSASTAGKLITSTAQNYSALENNNWSGMSAAIQNWRLAGTMGFTSLSDDVNGSDATVTGTYTSTIGGNKATRFALVKESDFLFFSYSWKIKEWQYDANANSSASDDPFQIQRIVK